MCDSVWRFVEMWREFISGWEVGFEGEMEGDCRSVVREIEFGIPFDETLNTLEVSRDPDIVWDGSDVGLDDLHSFTSMSVFRVCWEGLILEISFGFLSSSLFEVVDTCKETVFSLIIKELFCNGSLVSMRWTKSSSTNLCWYWGSEQEENSI